MISFEAESLVGFDGVESLVLKFVCLELGDEPNAATLFLLIKQNSCSGVGDNAQSELELLATVTTQRVEHVSREALRVNPH